MSAVLIIGLAAAAAGFALALSGRARRLRSVAEVSAPDVRRDIRGREAEGRPDEVPLLLELLGAMLQTGLSLPRALGILAGVAQGPGPALTRAAAALQLGTDWDHAWPEAAPGSEVDQLRAALHFSASTGAPSAELLYARARQLRRSRHRELEKRAAALGVRLVIPLGVCSLPAFLCLGVVPVLLAMMPGG
jgi:pilus assembly protein TadC